jgi:hypothetical protein
LKALEENFENPNVVAPLNDELIKRACLSFLKNFYKYRPRSGETTVKCDMTHSSGIIIDGYLSFPKENGSAFEATFEATSLDSSKEVQYSLQAAQLRWDGLAVSSFLTLLGLIVLWVFEIWSLTIAGFGVSFLLVGSIWGVIFLSYQFFLRQNDRYRYIYAIEQFKQYHADEQWIALGSNVFPDHQGTDFQELRMQCIRNGFGLMLVYADSHVDLLISPAREDVFGRKRRHLKFIENTPISNSLQQLKRVPAGLKRYKRPFLAQALACLVSVAGMSGIFYRQWQLLPIKTVQDQAAYRKEMEKQSLFLSYESDGSYVSNPDDMQKIDTSALSYTQLMPENVNASKPQPSATKTDIGLYIYTPTDGYLSYDCARANFNGTKYVIQDMVCRNFAEAKKRIEALKIQGIITNCISLDCTTNANAKGYSVFYEFMYNDEKTALKKAIEIKQNLKNLSLPDNLILRVLQF